MIKKYMNFIDNLKKLMMIKMELLIYFSYRV